MNETTLDPIHPGAILLEEFLEPLGISQYRLATSISVPPRCINEIMPGTRSITADTGVFILDTWVITEDAPRRLHKYPIQLTIIDC